MLVTVEVMTENSILACDNKENGKESTV